MTSGELLGSVSLLVLLGALTACDGRGLEGPEGECGNGVVEELEECDDGNEVDWDGCTACAITEYRINTFRAGHQGGAVVATSSDGSGIVVWEGEDFDGPHDGISARRISSSGLPEREELDIYIAHNAGWPAVDMMADGRFVVSWSCPDPAYRGVCCQVFAADGNPASAVIAVSSSSIWSSSVTSTSIAEDGRFVVVWASDGRDGDGDGVFGRLLDPSGEPIVAEFQVNTTSAGNQSWPTARMMPEGGFVVVWSGEAPDGSTGTVMGRRFDRYGEPDGDEFPVSADPETWIGIPAMSMNAHGDFVVAWAETERVIARRFDGHGPVDLSPFEVHPENGGVRAVELADDGRFIVAWVARLAGGVPLGDGEVFARVFRADGTPASSVFMANTHTPGNQSVPDIAIYPGGQFLIVWSSEGPGDDPSDVFAQRFDAAGNPLGTLPW